MTKQFESLFANNTQRRLGYRWVTCKHYKACDAARDLLNEWIIDMYEQDVVGKYEVKVLPEDPYPNGWPELYCRVNSTGIIEVTAWGRKDVRNHFIDCPTLGVAYQSRHDLVHHVQQPLDFGTEGELEAAHQMKHEFIEYAKAKGTDFATMKEAVNVLFSHTFLRVLGILWHLETYGHLDNYSHKIFNVCAK